MAKAAITSEPAIQTSGLSKRYRQGADYALKDLDIAIGKGEIYGYLGPNGAGKSTTIRLLMDFIRPTSGSAVILGRDTVRDSAQIKRSVGYLPGEIALYPNMTGRQFLDYMTSLLPLKHANHVSKLAATFKVPLNRKISDLSKGNRQKVAIIQAFAAEPEVLILDEPTSGLDPLMQEAFFELVRRAKAGGATIFFSSHNLTEVQKVCDRAGFIRDGRLVAEQDIGQLSSSAVQTYDISFTDPELPGKLKKLSGVTLSANTPRHVSVRIKGDLKPLFALLSRSEVTSIDRREIDLEDEFLKFYKGAGK